MNSIYRVTITHMSGDLPSLGGSSPAHSLIAPSLAQGHSAKLSEVAQSPVKALGRSLVAVAPQILLSGAAEAPGRLNSEQPMLSERSIHQEASDSPALRSLTGSVDEKPLSLAQNRFLLKDGKSLNKIVSSDNGERCPSETTPLPKRHAQRRHSLPTDLSTLTTIGAVSDHLLLGMKEVASYEKQGIPLSYLQQTQSVADSQNTLLAIRPVGAVCKTLIEEGCQSKGLDFKEKSSTKGPGAGFLPWNQKYSKLADETNPLKRQAAIDKFDRQHTQAQKEGTAPEIKHLNLSIERLKELKTLGAIDSVNRIPAKDGYQQACAMTVETKGEGTQRFEGHQKKDGSWDVFTNANGVVEPYMIIPKTADFDLLFTFTPYEQVDFSSSDRLRPYDAEKGVLTDRNRTLIDSLNTAYGRKPGYEMVHHGADTYNPATDMAVNLPTTVFIPASLQSKMGIYGQSPVLIKTEDELARLFRTMNKNGIRVEANKLWGELKEVALEEFREKVSFFESNKKDR